MTLIDMATGTPASLQRMAQRLALVRQAVREIRDLAMQDADPAHLVQRTCDVLTTTLTLDGAAILTWLDPSSRALGEGALFARSGSRTWPAGLAERLQACTALPAARRVLADVGIPTIEEGVPHAATPSAVAVSATYHQVNLLVVVWGAPPEPVAGWGVLHDLAQNVVFALHGKWLEQTHRQAIDALGESERRLSTLLSNLPGMAYRCRNDRDWTTEFASAGCRDLTGYAPDDLVGSRTIAYAALIHPEDREGVWDAVQAGLGERRPFQLTYRLIDAGGRTRWVWEQGRGVWDAGGELVALEGFITDVTQQVLAEQALRESEARFRGMFEASPLGIALVSIPNQRILQANRPICELLGYTLEELRARTVYDVTHPDDVDLDMRRIDAMFADEAPAYEVETRYVRKDGVPRWGEAHYGLMREHGRVTGVQAIAIDITERKQHEAQMQAALSEKEALLREVHHRVKNNLQVVCALLDLQTDAVTSEEARTALQESRHRIRSMADIHSQLTYAQDLARVDMRAYVQTLVDNLRAAYGAPQVTIRMEVSDVTLPFDQVSPCGLLINELVSNAIRHAFPDGQAGEIVISLRSLGGAADQVELAVRDTGVGLPAQLDPQASPTLGLTLIKLLAEQLGGTLHVDRRQGTAFRVVFHAQRSES